MTDIVKSNLPASSLTRPYSQWFEPTEALGIALIDHLFNRLDGAYPHKWRSNFANQQAIDNWAESWVEAFEEEGITPANVKDGLRECRRRFAWPPSCAEFIQACRPRIDPLSAYHEAAEQGALRQCGRADVWTSPAIFWAWMKVGRTAFNQLPYAMLKGRWEAALAAELAKAEHELIPPQMKVVPAPGRGVTSVEQARQLLAGFTLGTRQQGAVVAADPKAWARAIIAKRDRGEQLELVQIKDAERALGLRSCK
jgi:hypothetical protein